RGVRDDVAVVTEQRRDHSQDLGLGDRGLTRGAAVEHLVAELGLVVAQALGRHGVEYLVDLLAELGDLVVVEDAAHDRPAVAFELGARVRDGRVEHAEVLSDPLDHAPKVTLLRPRRPRGLGFTPVVDFDPGYGPLITTRLRIATWNLWGRYGPWKQRIGAI